MASFAALGVAAGCSGDDGIGVKPSHSPTPTPPPTAPPEAKLSWRALGAQGPKARSHHSLTANADGSIVFLYGGKTKGKIYDDAWAYDTSTKLWQPLPRGPRPSFGHSAGFVDGHLVIFGGQTLGGKFLNDAWTFDPIRGNWRKLSPAGPAPAPRYGAGGTTIDRSLVISHGFAGGRFDDTWSLTTRWSDVSPARPAPRPIKRCLHRTAYLSESRTMILFGGQTDGTPFLGDTWNYDPTREAWAETKPPGPIPSPRTLYASGATATRMFLFGGLGPGGPQNDVWSFDGTRWKPHQPSGTAPRRRGGVEGAVVAGPAMLVFGGTDGTKEFADLWQLSLS
jgi:N-acetylneuraminic acid mutarotase